MKTLHSFSTLLFCLATVAPAMTFATNLKTADIERVDTYLQQSVPNGFSGAVLIASEGNVVLKKGYGLADREAKRPNTADTVFDIGSVTKQFTAAAILKLAEQDKLKVSDPLTRFFADLPADKQAITLHQLLSHSAGIADSVGKSDFDHIPTEAYFSAVFASPLAFSPGTGYRYSNAGYSILARIVELSSGMEYESYLDKYLFKPAKMKETGYLLPEWDKDKLAKGYQYSAFNTGAMSSRYKADGKISWVLKGNGGFNSTLGDMYKWYLALSSNTVLSAASIQALTAPHVKEDPEGSSHYAYGWAVFQSKRDTKVIAHNGSNGTFFYDFVWMPEEELLITLASNAQVIDAMRLGRYIEKMLFEDNYTPRAFALDARAGSIKLALEHQGSTDALIDKVRAAYGNKVTRKRTFNSVGLALLDKDKAEQAIGLFTLNIELFPGDGNLWDSLGEAYLANGQNKEAIAAFDEALELGEKAERCYWCDNATAKRAEAAKGL